MSQSTQDRLYKLLPAIYRIRDSAKGEPLRALLAVIQNEMDAIEQDIDGLYNDLFIETCAEWVVPYIGDLLGVRSLHSVGSAGIFSQRAYVANTLRLRRRKGTAPVLEQLARDVTGWPSRAVEFFERLVTNQHLNHVRLHNLTTVDLRQGNALELLGGPFETAAHTLEVRRIAIERGKYNVPNIGLFLWRLQSYFVVQSAPRSVADPDDGRYRFSPLGNDIPLFNRPQTETEITHLAEEVNVPGPLRRRALYDDLEALRQALVEGQSDAQSLFLNTDNPAFQIFVENNSGELTEIPAEEILICDLSDLTGGTDWRRPPTSKSYTSWDNSVSPPVPLTVTRPIHVAVDPVLGRLAFPTGVIPPRVVVSYAYGFSGDMGGGPYSRRDTLATAAGTATWTRTVAQHNPEANHTTLAAALTEWAAGTETDAIITILDSGTYTEEISLAPTGQRNLVIQAADGERPTLRLFTGAADLGEFVVTGGNGAECALTLNGLWIEGRLRIDADSLQRLSIAHSTWVPGIGLNAASEPRKPDIPSLIAVLPNADLQIEVSHSIVGPLNLPEEIKELTVRDSIIHSPDSTTPALATGSAQPGPKTTLERVTIFGSVHVSEFALASETIFTKPVIAQKRQVGCTRFCFLPEGSLVPRRFRCQPDLALTAYAQKMGKSEVEDLTVAERESVLARVTPLFTSIRYGDPAYAQLSRACALEIRTGAEDGAEMGVFQHLKQPQREANLRASLAEYLRFGLEAGIFFVT